MAASTIVLRSGMGVGNPDVTGFVLHGLYPAGVIPPTPGTIVVTPGWQAAHSGFSTNHIMRP